MVFAAAAAVVVEVEVEVVRGQGIIQSLELELEIEARSRQLHHNRISLLRPQRLMTMAMRITRMMVMVSLKIFMTRSIRHDLQGIPAALSDLNVPD